MHPAYSVVFLTTLIGAGQGLFVALVLVEALTLLRVLPPDTGNGSYATGSAVALALLVAGLVASFFHLGRPERAWRSAAMWRTSWLSREVIVLPALMAAVALYGLLHAAGWNPVLLGSAPGPTLDLSLAVGLAGMVLALLLFVCTGMIYACVRFLAEWHTPLTPINFTLLGGASGFTLAAALASVIEPQRVEWFVTGAMVLTALGALGRGAALLRNRRLKPRSTLQSAIGVKHPQVVQRSMGFMGGSFNTREFFQPLSPGGLRQVMWWFVVGAFIAPLVLLAAALAAGSSQLPIVAFVVQYAGLLAERWFFLAQSRHPQNLYYQAVS